MRSEALGCSVFLTQCISIHNCALLEPGSACLDKTSTGPIHLCHCPSLNSPTPLSSAAPSSRAHGLDVLWDQHPPAVPASHTAWLQLPDTPQGWAPLQGLHQAVAWGAGRCSRESPGRWCICHPCAMISPPCPCAPHMGTHGQGSPIPPRDPALLTGYLAPHLCHQHSCQERNEKQNPP